MVGERFHALVTKGERWRGSSGDGRRWRWLVRRQWAECGEVEGRRLLELLSSVQRKLVGAKPQHVTLMPVTPLCAQFWCGRDEKSGRWFTAAGQSSAKRFAVMQSWSVSALDDVRGRSTAWLGVSAMRNAKALWPLPVDGGGGTRLRLDRSLHCGQEGSRA